MMTYVLREVKGKKAKKKEMHNFRDRKINEVVAISLCICSPPQSLTDVDPVVIVEVPLGHCWQLVWPKLAW